MKTPEAIAQVRRMVTQAAEDAGLPARITVPAPTWDNTGQMIGVVIESPKKMGDQPCLFSVSFVLSPEEYANPLTITAKTSAALMAIRYSVQSKVRPLQQKQEAA